MMSTQLLIEQLPNEYLLASVKDTAGLTYVTNEKGKPLKFLSIAHIKEFFEGHPIKAVHLMNSDGSLSPISRW
jgi:hypothetical protein